MMKLDLKCFDKIIKNYDQILTKNLIVYGNFKSIVGV